jgi:hypothetical protein
MLPPRQSRGNSHYGLGTDPRSGQVISAIRMAHRAPALGTSINITGFFAVANDRLSTSECVLRETVAKDECGYYYEDNTAHPELPKQHAHFSVKALTDSRSMSLIKKQSAKFYFRRPLRLTSSARRRCLALSNWFTRLVRSATCLLKAIIRPRATTLSPACAPMLRSKLEEREGRAQQLRNLTKID